ncbi:MAG TPA: 3-hydroxyacyl-CoA dehydrogenase/enoyl-CoA hydratase family protein [Gemmatimonadaceae bacterium]|nr:3-hydroxyacyl-CoA dehydrogenase/enoyl-CoA hydratase family protein [Gemmatimonadaceae bacterium]
MAFQFRGLALSKVGVVGSGNIGPDIALHFAKALAPDGVAVVVVDIAPDALARGRAKLEQKVAKARETKAFSDRQAAAILAAVTFTDDYAHLADAGLVVEAATENLDVKKRIFAQLEALVPADAVLASNSSHIEPELIFSGLRDRGRALVLHYFFPAERNPVVEIVSGPDTSPALADDLLGFYEAIGKVPVRVHGRYGYAVNPVFEGLFLAAALCVEEGMGTVKEVDAAAKRALGLGIGPFTAMNLTGGNPITAHALDEMTTRVGPWFRSPQLMKDAMAAGRPWDVARRNEAVELPADRERVIGDAMLGAYFGLVGEILDSGIVSLGDLELAVELGLVVRAPFAFMNALGVDRALALVQAYAAAHPGFPVPAALAAQARAGRPFDIPYVLRRDADDVAVLTIRRPQVLNALNDEVYRQLQERFAALRDDPRIRAVVLTAFGTKAFVSGADINFLASIATPDEGFRTSQRSKEAGNLIERLGKPVVCALNGSAFGGGSELAMCCTTRIARSGLAVAMAQPEANLGIVPGAGATQRLPRLVGVERAAEMLRTGRPLSGAEAVACGLIREEVDGDVVDAAIRLARAAADGDVTLAALDPRPLDVPPVLPDLALGHLSQAIDRLMCRAIVEGCRQPLDGGLRFESEMFGACCATEDMRIGVRNFFDHGPRAHAEFVHR